MMYGTLGILVIVKALVILCVTIHPSCTKTSTKYLKWKKDKRKQRLTIKVLIINLKTKGNEK